MAEHFTKPLGELVVGEYILNANDVFRQIRTITVSNGGVTVLGLDNGTDLWITDPDTVIEYRPAVL